MTFTKIGANAKEHDSSRIRHLTPLLALHKQLVGAYSQVEQWHRMAKSTKLMSILVSFKIEAHNSIITMPRSYRISLLNLRRMITQAKTI